ncbi:MULTISPECIES: GAF domain-containing protein [unclassified Mesorhizobium]|uniref:GAF domain-containing protein n=1 Tax=unclassified Mesorhizobium TaxID=325217 RepID=UPI000F75B10E|nr:MULTISPECIES: GAF domain-containing protein [unclassified Mesorhizobium]AZO68813.1 GAF domain-containing protein [Mesorhizobium sp. M6A.T.Cr.TU.016.01.1.1]RWP56845.1 MAG: GAF domain-containing protein [Mesorhizobium sp.]RWQ89529.1 MAG: GAF domain-containing protein [Mesorhizobium sp.]
MRESHGQLEARIELLTFELNEALERETATGELLRVIASSPTDIKPVLDAVAASAARLCDAYDVIIRLKKDNMLHLGAHSGPIAVDEAPWPLERDRVMARSVIDARTVQVEDLSEAGAEFAAGREMAIQYGFRTILATPLVGDGRAIGAISLRRREVRPFSDRQIELLKTFADQAVMAISNVRLFEEVQARTAELSEALAQQTATADVLKVISRSAFDLEPVLQTLLDSAIRLAGGDMGAISLRDGDWLRVMTGTGWTDELRAYEKSHPHPIGRGTFQGRAALEGATVHVPDVSKDMEYKRPEAATMGDFRAALSVPLKRGQEVIGVFGMARRTVGPFSQRQIELVESFADQAVIAIENVRLFDEVQARNREVTEALERETATGSILRVIAASPTDIQPVLDAVAESAARLCDAHDATIYLRQGDRLAVGAHHGPIPVDDAGLPVARDVVTGRAVLDRAPVHVHDLTEAGVDFATGRAMAHRLGFRTILAIPLLRDGEAVGALMIRRIEMRPFTDKQIALLKTFADQAVIAISNVRLFEEVQARTRDLQESLEYQTATSDVLGVISRSPAQAQPVLDTIVTTAGHLCEADYAYVYMRKDDGKYHLVAAHPADAAQIDYWRANPVSLDRGTTTGRTALERRTVHIPDATADPAYTRSEWIKLSDARTFLGVPLLRDGDPIGVIAAARRRTVPFSDRQIELITTFADQAVIAIENARLFEEVQARTAELTEALAQQTATADVLKVISASTFDLKAVLQTLIESAVKLCGAELGGIYMLDGDVYRISASHGDSPELRAHEEAHPNRVGRDSWVGRAALERVVVHVPDVTLDLEYGTPDVPKIGKFAAGLSVPLLREGIPIGVFSMARAKPGPFSERQIELVQTFADQAVIAIENVRLFEEVQQRTREATEALEYQTATSDVLGVISRSPTDVQPVFNMIAQSAARLCEAQFCFVYRYDGQLLHFVAHHGITEESVEIVRNTFPVAPTRGSAAERAILYLEVAQIPDLTLDSEFTHRAAAAFSGLRSVVAVPVLRDGLPIGCIAVGRAETGFLAAKQVELLKTFADQAVIAIENVRLFDEVQARTAELSESLQQQTATADVLKVISASAFDLQTVLDTLVESAVRLCRADKGCLERIIDGRFEYAAITGFPPGFREYGETHQTEPGRGSAVGRAAEELRVIQIEDVTVDPEYTHSAIAAVGGMSTVLAVPLLREGELLGTFAMIRTEVRPFNEREIELVKTFADQAVIAIQNVRLFDEVQARTADVSEALRQQTATADVLKVISRAAFDLPTVLNALVESAAKLCGASYGGIFLRYGNMLRGRATISERKTDWMMDHPIAIDRRWLSGRVALSGSIEYIPDVEEDADFNLQEFRAITDTRALMGVPMLREGKVEGVFFLGKMEPNSFTSRQGELVQTFADQAVIAIENVRLFDQVQARTEELSCSLDDLRKAQDRLVQTEKLASLGQLTAGIAHEIKNPLNFVNNFSSLSGDLVVELREALQGAAIDDKIRAEIDELSDMLKGNLDKVVQHGKRADSIVRNMLLHSRSGSGEHRPVDINAVVEESLNLAYHGARAEGKGFNIMLERNFDPGAGEVDLFPQEITRVLLNLISNGFYATTKRRAAEGETGYEPVLAASTKSLGDAVEIRIRDNGTGIPPEVKEKMFNPFFTTKPAGEGTGLGLSLSHDIVVKQHAGTIEVDTEPGAFTEFRIVLPRGAATLAKAGGNA